jgi:hypothetical protein
MGAKLSCQECDKLKIKNYKIELSHCSTTELYSYPTTILGITYIPKRNTKTSHYICSNGHTFTKKEKCK